jgi:hypothetical protein
VASQPEHNKIILAHFIPFSNPKRRRYAITRDIIQDTFLTNRLHGDCLPLDMYFWLLFDLLNHNGILAWGLSSPASGEQFTKLKARECMCFRVEDDLV